MTQPTAQAQAQPARKFRMLLRDGGGALDMGGEQSSVGVRYVDWIFSEALEKGASDIHLQPERNQLRIRLRTDGVMHQVGSCQQEYVSNVIARIKLAAGMHLDERREPQDGRIDMEYMNRRFSARVSVLPSMNGEKVVMRILDPANARIDIKQLGMSPEVLEKWTKSIRTPYGMIIVTGPTGSGKTSTLYASINLMDRIQRNIVTVEDPIEYEFQDNITQVQVSERMSFPTVMRSFLRQDPDVMMVGEMRDPESLAIGIQASLTGHLVLTTLHTNNAWETLGRMVEMKGEPYLIASTVVCIVAQRLVRVNCSQCREEYEPQEEQMFALGIRPQEAAHQKFYRGRGCNHCRNIGFKGRTGVFELMVNTRAIKELTTHNANAIDIFRAARTQGMRTMLEDGRDKVLLGITTPEEVVHAVYTSAMEQEEKPELEEMMLEGAIEASIIGV